MFLQYNEISCLNYAVQRNNSIYFLLKIQHYLLIYNDMHVVLKLIFKDVKLNDKK